MEEKKSAAAKKTAEKKGNMAMKDLTVGQVLMREFMDFLKEYKIIGLAIGFIMGAAATDLVKSIVNNLVMPLITPFIPGGAWQSAVLKLGPIVIAWGALLSSIINFTVLAFVVFLIAKIILREEKVTKK